MSYTSNEKLVDRTVEDEMKESYLRYSMSVIIARALPDVRDGLKPSQRRILYAMLKLNLSPGAKFRKCAKISGDTSGDYHPHGEQVIYPTLVRLAQTWVMRYNLIQGQGNFGSIDGDPPAAMRYTEARLTHASVALMADLEKDTVDMVPNYDETRSEPVVFPAEFPQLLCNGSSGIAVGMATNIPPHNLQEVIKATQHLLENPDATVDELIQLMPAPDFPTGGVICGYRGVKEAYHTGRGKITLRGTHHLEGGDEGGDGKTKIVIDEIPYLVNKSRLIEQFAELVTSKTIPGVADLRDESDKDGLRIVLELKKNELPEVTLNQLYKFSDYQVTFGCNMLALDKGLPKIFNIKKLIAAWIDHRIEVIRRRTQFELNKAEARAHILEGYLIAIEHLDEIVKVIKESADRDAAKAVLMARYGFSERQATAVLELRLYQLTGLERDKVAAEYQELQQKIAYYRAVLASEALVRGIIKDELQGLLKHHPSPRLTKIIAAEGEMEMEDLIANESAIITISEDDYIKRMPITTFKEQRRGGQGIAGIGMKRDDDAIKGVYVANAHDTLMIFTTLGRCYWLKVWQVPEAGRKSKGKPLINLLEDFRPDERIATILRVEDFTLPAAIFMATKKGVVKKTALEEFSTPRRKGVYALTIDDGDQMIGARLVTPGEQVMLFTYKGMAVRFDEGEVRQMGRTARGVRGATLRDEDDCIVGCEVVTGKESLLIVCENGYGKRSNVEEFRQTRRGGVGVRSIITSERNGNVVSALSVTDADGIVMMSAGGQTVRISMRDVRVMGRSTQGVRLAYLRGENDTLVAVQKIAEATTATEVNGVELDVQDNVEKGPKDEDQKDDNDTEDHSDIQDDNDAGREDS